MKVFLRSFLHGLEIALDDLLSFFNTEFHLVQWEPCQWFLSVILFMFPDKVLGIFKIITYFLNYNSCLSFL